MIKSSGETYTIGKILSFPKKVTVRYREKTHSILAQFLEQHVISECHSCGSSSVHSNKLSTLVLKIHFTFTNWFKPQELGYQSC